MISGSIISKIIESKKSSIEIQKEVVSENILLEGLSSVSPVRNFSAKISEYAKNRKIGVISVVKKAVPIKGVLRKYFNLNRIVKSFEQSGSIAIAVNTEETFYLGKKEYLKEASTYTNLPILRQDVILDQYQILESRIYGADAVSLNLSILDVESAIRLEKLARELEMDVVLEVGDIKQLDIVEKLNSKVICVDNRNPRTLEIDINTTKEFAARFSDNHILISKNGIQSRDDITKLVNHNVFLFMIGEYALSKPSIKAAMEILLKQ